MERTERILADLRRRYFDDTSAPRGQGLLDEYRSDEGYEDLAYLLRHHDEDTVEEDETWDRDAIDDLIGYYSILEVASIAGAIPDLPRADAALASENLGDLIVRVYYEEHYPLTLPGLFRQRLRGAQMIRENGQDCLRWFYRFLAIDQQVDQNSDVDDFLWLIDGGTLSDHSGDYDIDDLFAVLADETDFRERMHLGRRSRTRLDDSLHGLRIFIVFGLEFDSLLKACRGLPLLRAAFWHHHSYWFGQLDWFFGRKLPKALDRITRWSGRAKAPEMRHLIDREVHEAQRAFERLSSGRYGAALNRWL
jgi:hypothetical protein